MKLVTWNVNGIRACAPKGLLDYLRRESPDILCLQETKAHPNQLGEELLHPPGWEAYWSAAQKAGYSGTVTYTKQKPEEIQYGIQIRKFDSEGRFVVTRYPEFLLYNVYFPNGAASEERHLYKQEFLEKFRKHLERKIQEGHEVVVVGDYNVAYRDTDVFDPVRLSKVSGFLPEERAWFGRFLETGFVDLFAHFHPRTTEQYTWWSYRENARIANRGWRIDHICVTPQLVNQVKSIDIQDQQMGSDHCPVKVVMEF